MAAQLVNQTAATGTSTAVDLPVRPAGRPVTADMPKITPSGGGDQNQAMSDAEFLVRQATAQATGGERRTFARFVVDPKTHEVSVQIVDAGSQEVIRSIPGDELKQMARTYRATSGFVFDSAV